MRRAVTKTLQKLGVDTAAIGLKEERDAGNVGSALLVAERAQKRDAQNALNAEHEKLSAEVADIMRQAQAEMDRIAADENLSEEEKAAALAAVRAREKKERQAALAREAGELAIVRTWQFRR